MQKGEGVLPVVVPTRGKGSMESGDVERTNARASERERKRVGEKKDEEELRASGLDGEGWSGYRGYGQILTIPLPRSLKRKNGGDG